MTDIAIKIENLRKQYKLGAIGGRTLNAELQSWWARKRGKEDPNLKIGQDYSNYGETFWALDGINLEIKKGEAVGIIGANGAGKSTLLKILSRVTAPTEGDIWIDGRIASMLEVGTGFHAEMTGRENIYMNGAILGMTKKEVDEKIESIIDFSECRQFIDTPVKRYSSGMYVKLAFAVASHLDAEIMIMDEVLAVGDMKFQKKCLGKMGDEAKGGKTVLYVSHNMATIRNLCSRCIVLDKGKMIFDGDVEKGIDVYISSSCVELQQHIDNTLFIRHSYDLGKKLYLKEIDFLDEGAPKITDTRNINLRLSWDGIEHIEKIKLGFSLKGADGSNIGFGYTEKTFESSCGSNTGLFRIDLSNLAPGFYYLCLNMFASGESGDLHSLDQSGKIAIEIVDTGQLSIIWQKQYWGNLIVNPIVKIDA